MAIERSEASAIRSSPDDEVSLLEILDHVLNAGVVIQGSIVISVAGVDLVYLGMNLVLTSVETAMKHIDRGPTSIAGKLSRRR